MGASKPDGHLAVVELLPWYVNGTLEDADRRLVDGHIADCAECAAELELERRLQHSALEAFEGVEEWTPPQGQLERLMDRLPTQLPESRPETVSAARSGFVERIRARWVSWPESARWAVATQSALAAGLLGVILWQAASISPAPAPYQTLSTPAPLEAAGRARLQIAFTEDTTEAELRSLLRDSDVSLAGGPSALGIYTIEAPHGIALEDVVRALRADPRVRLVEPIVEPEP